MNRPWSHLARFAPWGVGLLMAAPILLFRYPPMGDLAMHEALVAIMRHRHDATWAPAGMYFVVAPQANQLFHFLAYALSFIVPTDVACKLVVATIVALSPVAMARFLKHLGLSPWSALLVLPIVCGWMFIWGLVANMIGFTLLVAFLPLAERVARRPTRRNVAAAVAASCVLFFAHESSALFFASIVGAAAVVRSLTWKGFLPRIVPVLTTLALAAGQWRLSQGLAGANMRAIGSSYGDDAWARLQMLPGAVFGGLGTSRVALIAFVWLAALFMGVSSRQRRRPRRLPVRVAIWRARHPLLAALFFVAFVTFPMSLGGTTLLAHRFLPVAGVFLVAACAPRAITLRHAALATCAPLIMLGASMNNFKQASQRFRDLDAILALMPDNVAVAQLDLTPQPAGRVGPVPGAACRALAVHGGRILFSFSDMPPNPVYTRPDLQWNEPVLRLGHAPFAFIPPHDARRFEYLITLNRRPSLRPVVQKALAPEEALIASRGDWDLYRSTLLTTPLDAPDAPLPAGSHETLADRVNRELRAGEPARAAPDGP